MALIIIWNNNHKITHDELSVITTVNLDSELVIANLPNNAVITASQKQQF